MKGKHLSLRPRYTWVIVQESLTMVNGLTIMGAIPKAFGGA